jgi:hypothetical protein
VPHGRQHRASGLAWTLDRDIACWFAYRRADRPGATPLVLTAEVPRRAVLLHHTERGEAEVVCFNVRNAVVDGDVADWLAAGERYERQKKADEVAWMADVMARRAT